MRFPLHYLSPQPLLRHACYLSLLAALSACKPATDAEKAAARAANAHVSPIKDLSQGRSLQNSVADLKNEGFQCENFNNAMHRPVMRCTRIKGEGVKACADSVWLEYDAQQNVRSVAPYNECN